MARKVGILFLALAFVAIGGWLDYATGAEVRSILFYVGPIVFSAWVGGRASVVIVSAASAVAWALAEFMFKDYTSGLTAVWNEVSTVVVLMAIGLLITSMRGERDSLRAAALQIRELLANEARNARTDALTGLPNSREFLERLEPEIARCRRDGTPLCLVYVDLDNFKLVNDRYGHPAGDEVLRRVAAAMRTHLRAADVLARLGGDEFAAMLWQSSAADAQRVGERILDSAREIGLDYPGCGLTASVGAVWFDTPPDDANEAVRRADHAMYDAKKAGKGRVVVISTSDAATAHQQPSH